MIDLQAFTARKSGDFVLVDAADISPPPTPPRCTLTPLIEWQNSGGCNDTCALDRAFNACFLRRADPTDAPFLM